MSRLLVAALLLSACGSRERLTDVGQVCLGTESPSPGWASDTGGEEIAIEADAAFPVTVVFSECASGSTEWIEQSCSTTVEGDVLTISSFARTSTPSSVTADCNFITHACGTVTLGAGSWTVVYGDSTEALDVPYEGAPICIDGA